TTRWRCGTGGSWRARSSRAPQPMAEPTRTVKAVDEATWAAFAALVERNNGVFGGCWCMGFHAEGVGKDTTAAQNRERKHERGPAGTTHAALVLDREEL